MNQKHKTLRSFYCEDSLWEMFEVMSRDLDCSMDYLINESMRHYARSRNYSLTGMSRMRQQQSPGYGQGGYPTPPIERQGPPPPPVQTDNRTIPLNSPYAGGGRPTFERPAVASPQPQQGFDQPYYRTGSQQRVPPPPPRQAIHQQGQYGYRPPTRQPVPPPPPTRDQWAGGYAPGGKAPLYLYFNGQRYVINKDRFVVGRGSQGTDLTIRDGNISRKHAAVIYHEGAYFIQDLGSTNGIEFNGAKIDSKRIDEGDLLNICDYELRFSYHG